jgi:hypothetical protein
VRWPIYLAALVLGCAIGGGVRLLREPSSESGGFAVPLTAREPELPADAPLTLLPDPDLPPLKPGTKLVRARIGTADFPLYARVPSGWTAFPLTASETRWVLPGNPSFTYALRIKNVADDNLTIEQIIDLKLQRLAEDEQEFRVLERFDDGFKFEYVEAQYQRVGYLRFLDPNNSGEAAAEVSVNGREADDPGMRDLLNRVCDSITN